MEDYVCIKTFTIPKLFYSRGSYGVYTCTVEKGEVYTLIACDAFSNTLRLLGDGHGITLSERMFNKYFMKERKLKQW